jgi:hypothetical protein
MFKKRKKDLKKKIKEEENKVKASIHKAEDTIKKDFNKAKEFINQDFKKIETPENVSFFATYGWAIAVIVICLVVLGWWSMFSVHSEYCEFKEGSGLLCEKFDITNTQISVELRNMNNKSITINKVEMGSCSIEPSQNIGSNDKRTVNIDCEISSGRLKDKIVVAYTIEDFEKHSVAKISKIVP